MRDRVEQDELDYDMQQGQWTPEKSLFADAEYAEELEAETNNPLDGHWSIVDGKEEWRPRKNVIDMANGIKQYKADEDE